MKRFFVWCCFSLLLALLIAPAVSAAPDGSKRKPTRPEMKRGGMVTGRANPEMAGGGLFKAFQLMDELNISNEQMVNLRDAYTVRTKEMHAARRAIIAQKLMLAAKMKLGEPLSDEDVEGLVNGQIEAQRRLLLARILFVKSLRDILTEQQRQALHKRAKMARRMQHRVGGKQARPRQQIERREVHRIWQQPPHPPGPMPGMGGPGMGMPPMAPPRPGMHGPQGWPGQPGPFPRPPMPPGPKPPQPGYHGPNAPPAP
jgi:hypothetical protein